MRLRQGSIVATLIAISVGLPACTRTSAEELAPPPPASVESIAGSDVARVTLTSDAARRLDVRTAPVREFGLDGSRPLLVIPYAAVLYDPTGGTWTYTSPQPLVFVRVSIDVDRILGDEAVLSSGPEPGTEVVIVGTSELWGTENQVGEE